MSGRPRSTEIDRALAAATVTLLEEVGFDALTLDAVASRAGVSRPTLYRRWPTKLHLVAHVVANRVPLADPDTGSTREDLLVLANALVSGLSWVVLAVHAEARRVPGLLDGFLAGRHALVDGVVRRGIARGELRPDTDPELVRDLLFGPLVYHWLATDRPRSAETVFDAVWPLFSQN
ncbi:TetR/AcrR family transcriptional regulator [Actinosynnema sp. NPDC047251]|uniref:Transcriptional regulator, TetR family n=1 Tax=Saccharothrix espanaensis (strain ATCC 51144 / DSM 44229 / JCM 9112 / NBRC 15066 / NRRL 15764) TaxID=1179773 RepID=K0K1Y1_SACES|nr:TetR/AcrR family transcriptional regulator [Saccharothrix espanaensis]CCH34240.1 Transcriptional regulator, TetR family [Saccharothrix espanaensis DSM 44229]